MQKLNPSFYSLWQEARVAWGQIVTDTYSDLQETIDNQDEDSRNVRQKVILRATFCGGPRYMFEMQQVATVAYVRNFGRPDLFITVTTNPN